jgi:hypothetical protein
LARVSLGQQRTNNENKKKKKNKAVYSDEAMTLVHLGRDDGASCRYPMQKERTQINTNKHKERNTKIFETNLDGKKQRTGRCQFLSALVLSKAIFWARALDLFQPTKPV